MLTKICKYYCHKFYEISARSILLQGPKIPRAVVLVEIVSQKEELFKNTTHVRVSPPLILSAVFTLA